MKEQEAKNPGVKPDPNLSRNLEVLKTEIPGGGPDEKPDDVLNRLIQEEEEGVIDSSEHKWFEFQDEKGKS